MKFYDVGNICFCLFRAPWCKQHECTLGGSINLNKIIHKETKSSRTQKLITQKFVQKQT